MEFPPFLIFLRQDSSIVRSEVSVRFRSNGKQGKECLTDRGEIMTTRWLSVVGAGEEQDERCCETMVCILCSMER
jgi:hypothetical protein